MKSIILCAICISSVLLVLAVQSGQNSMTCYKQELEEALSIAVSQTLKEVFEQDSFGIENRNQFVAAFLQALIVRTNSDADMEVCILTADVERGLLDIEVKEKLPEGQSSVLLAKDREIIVRRTVVFDQRTTLSKGAVK